MRVQLSRIHEPVTALGHGRRVGVWFQGCSLGCRGCVSRDTWDPAGGFEAEVADLVALVADRMGDLDGLTITGGEPFEQAAALVELLGGVAVARHRAGRAASFDVLCYSGLAWATLQQHHGAALGLIDALVPEPFRAGDAPGPRWRGSANQPLVPLTELGRARYASLPEPRVREIQVAEAGGSIWLIGTPEPGDLRRTATAVADAGVQLEGVSWLP